MDPVKNPFSPGAGSPPPELVGREPILENARILLERVSTMRSEKSILLTGLRGVGKTVLLNEINHIAENIGYKTVIKEVHENKPLGALLALPLRKLLFSLDRSASAGNKAKKALRVLKSFASAVKVKVGEVELGLDIEPELGTADSGDIEEDLPDLFIAVAEAAKEKHCAIALLLDEVQYLAKEELSALIMAMHKIQQKQLPLAFIGAGLPVLPALAGDSKSYAERLLQFPNIGPLTQTETMRALQDPLENTGVSFTEAATNEIFQLTEGYPYFLQEWGYQAWNLTIEQEIDLTLIQETTSKVIKRLDENFFRVRFDRLTPNEKQYLRAMAEMGKGPHRTSDIAELLQSKLSSLGPVRSRLIKKGMIFSPSFGEMAFTVPLFDEFMRRIMPYSG